MMNNLNEEINSTTNENLTPIDLCIELDIGTSTTKATITEKNENIFYAVDFKDFGIAGEENLIPTCLAEDKQTGVFSLPKYGEPYTYTNLKINFLENKENSDLYLHKYIALIIQYIKSWFKKQYGDTDIVKNRKIYWHVNTGIPSIQFVEEQEEQNKNLTPIDLCIGLDIGTSTTKAVVRQGYTDEEGFYVVDFKDFGITDATYLIPTYLLEDKQTGVFSLPKYKGPYSHINLKVNFLENKENSDLYLRAYIALVIQYIKSWFKKQYGDTDIVKNREIYWHVNMGIPSEQFNTENENAKFLKILKEAYSLSASPKISVESSIIEEQGETDLNIIPEIVAVIQSYVQKNNVSHEGLYFVSDIGAGTLDNCIFRLSEDKGNKIYSFFATSVQRLGAQEYQKSLFKYKESLSRAIERKEEEIQYESLNHIVIDPSKYLISAELQNLQKQDVDAFKSKVIASYTKVLHKTYNYKDGKDPKAEEWGKYVPLALSGGGSFIPFYKDVICNDVTAYLKNCKCRRTGKSCRGFQEIDCTVDQKNLTMKGINPKRLAVAIGLSYLIDDFNDIKKYYLEWEIENAGLKRKEEVKIESPVI